MDKVDGSSPSTPDKGPNFDIHLMKAHENSSSLSWW